MLLIASVFRLIDTRLDRIVAIKVASVGFRERFEREARVAKPDSEIDYSDIPPMASHPKTVYVGRPQKQQVSLRVDSDVLAWFRSKSKQYQSHMNEVLRREMPQQPGNE